VCAQFGQKADLPMPSPVNEHAWHALVDYGRGKLRQAPATKTLHECSGHRQARPAQAYAPRSFSPDQHQLRCAVSPIRRYRLYRSTNLLGSAGSDLS